MKERERERKERFMCVFVLCVCVVDLRQPIEGGVGFECFSNLACIGDLIAPKTVLIQKFTPQKKKKKQEH